MRFLLQIVCTALLSYLAEQWLPWWTIVLCAAAVAMGLPTTRWAAFSGGFAAISLLWMLTATLIDVKNQGILAIKVAPLFGLQSPAVLILLTGLVGGLAGGLGALSGQQLHALMTYQEKDTGYRRY